MDGLDGLLTTLDKVNACLAGLKQCWQGFFWTISISYFLDEGTLAMMVRGIVCMGVIFEEFLNQASGATPV